jgi:hypothetical protein
MPRIPTVTAARVAVASSFGFLVVTWIATQWVGDDTPFVLDGSNALLTSCRCTTSMHAVTREAEPLGLMIPIGYWTMLQHIPDVISIELGTRESDRWRVHEPRDCTWACFALF